MLHAPLATRAVVVAAVLGGTALGLGGALLLGGCGQPAPTYANRTKAIFDAKCNGCHREGGIGPMALTSYDDVAHFKDIIVPAIDSRVMPPWMPAQGCTDYSNDYSLSDNELAALDAWFASDMPVGDPAAATPAAAPVHDPTAQPIRYDELFDAADEPFLPSFDDEYRCYTIPWPYDVDKYITGFDMIPGDPTNVHHVNVFLNPPPTSADDDFVAFDADDPEPGFSCGRPHRVLNSSLVGAWAPGASGTAYPAGTGQLVAPGSNITLEVHYAHAAGALPDSSKLALQTADAVEQRGIGVAFYWFNNWDEGGMDIPAHDPNATHDLEVDPALELAVVAPWITARTIDVHMAALHMHARGKSGELAIHRSDGTDQCLLQIPDWDFNWQMGYALEKPAQILRGDKLYLRCTWDNSASDVDVNWGDRVTDEMCIGFLYLVPEQ